MQEIIKGNKNKKIRISVQQMYSKRTQLQIDEANNLKRELKESDKKHWPMYVKYPGVLMVKKPGDKVYSRY